MKKSILIALAALVAFSAQGGDYSAYYKDLPITLEQPAAPVIPALTVSVTDFGGVGDGVTLNTEAFKKAIAKLDKQGGGHLTVPAGIWLTGPISFKSRIDLHVDPSQQFLDAILFVHILRMALFEFLDKLMRFRF